MSDLARERLAFRTRMRALVGAAALAGCPAGASTIGATPLADPASESISVTGEWESLPPLPVAVRSPAAVAVDGLIYVIGGSEASNRRTRAVQVYDPSLAQWSRMQDAPAGWDFHTAVAIDRRIHVISGALDDGAQRGHWVLNLRTGYWQQRAPIAVAVNTATAQVVDGDIHVFGGVVGRDYRSLIQVYAPETDTWRFGGDLPTGRLSSVSGVINRRVHLVGGGIPEYQTTPQHLIFDPSTRAIASARDYPHAMEAGGGGVVDGVFCVFGGRLATQGRRNEPFSDTNCYTDGRWIELPALLTPRAEMAHVTLDGMIYAIGGDGARPSMDTVERLVIVVERP